MCRIEKRENKMKEIVRIEETEMLIWGGNRCEWGGKGCDWEIDQYWVTGESWGTGGRE